MRAVSLRPSGTILAADPLARVAALPGVREAADSARSAVDTLLRHRVLRRQSAEVTAEASLRAARACAALEGYEISLDELRAHLARSGPEGVLPGPEETDASKAGAVTDRGTRNDAAMTGSGHPLPVVLGTVRLYAELGILVPAWERAPRQALARMHVLLGRGFVPDDELGRPRADAGTRAILDPLRLGPPPHSVETSVRLDGLTGLLVAPTSAPAIVVAAVVHGELLALRPFGALDGVIARAAARLVLIGRGLDPKALTATDVGHLEMGQNPASILRVDRAGDAHAGEAYAGEAYAGDAYAGYREAAAAYVGGGADGVAIWVRHCAKALELAARESLAVCEALART
ncbi:hypothetical protein ThrDRAFT_01566 [Frankia casuarinae]|nr:hypothetical protein CcI6DRAFT_01982 [Frankia sp. CcI6]EYT92790.1 hypothetical protein ThrDRAFT_01566 [Frankia casuarinae]KFB07117.1 hypothetical protein ALLO2DRAFT_00412 [Frankia sp. Allo2]